MSKRPQNKNFGERTKSQIEAGLRNQSEIVKTTWNKQNEKLEDVNIYSLEKTITKLRKKYKKYFGRAGNRKLIVDDLQLYKSVKFYATVLYFNLTKSQLRFSADIIFIVKFNGDIEKLKCKCGNFVTYSPTKKVFSKICKRCELNNRSGIPNELLNEWQLYKRIVLKLTNRTYRKFKNEVNPKNYKRGYNGCYQLDHIFSVYDGFKNHVPPFIISDNCNLRMLPFMKNMKKSRKSDITLNQLIEKYYAA